jgi:undecaprenyl pyrophosphate synthase
MSTVPHPLAEIPRDRWPRHIAVIMDGNGRWAQARGLRAPPDTARASTPSAAS